MRSAARLAVTFAGAIGVILIGLAGTASASSVGGSLPAGSSVCTDQTGSTNGVSLSGIVSTPGARVTWTVRAADAAGGAEAEIFRAATYDVTGTNVAAPRAGSLLYRICLNNTTRSPVSFSHVFAVPRPGGGSGQANLGPTTSILGPNGTVCGELIASSRRLTATSNVPVTWFVRAYNGDLIVPRSIRPLTATSTSVDQVIGPGAYAFLDVCAINHSTTQTATPSMQFAAP
jgi:hypothetical protein